MNIKKTSSFILTVFVITVILVAAVPGNVTNLKNVTYAPDYIKWTWKDPTDADFSHVMVHINGQFETNVTNGIEEYNATGLEPDTEYIIGIRTVDNTGNISIDWQNDTARTSPVVDNIPPASITDLDNNTYKPTYINWVWQDPNDEDFDKVKIYINGRFKTDVGKGIESYNATNLTPNTTYRISTRTVDISGNINRTWSNKTARTAPQNNINDTTPPTSISDLDNNTYKPTYINWVWQDPNDEDFDKVKIYINGIFETDVEKGIESYNDTNLTPNTTYEISTHTVDNNNNINSTWVNHTARTANNINDTTPPASITDPINNTYEPTYITWTWNDPNDEDFAKVMIYINGQFKENVTKSTEEYNATGLRPNTEYEISTHTVDNNNNINLTWVNHTARTSVDGPKITIINQPDNFNVTVGGSLSFNISVDQAANITWKVGNDSVKSERILSNKTSNFTFKSSTKGTYNIKVIAENSNGTDNKNWQIIVRSKTYSSGNRIWDGSKPDEYSLTYTWNPMSFSGFYYDVNSNAGDESITMTLDNYQDRSINKGKLIYSTTPDDVSFDYSDFGKYQVIGFMADKYFAGYTDNTTPPHPTDDIRKISVIAQGQLHKVLLDDSEKRLLSVGSTVTLKEGYVIKAKDIGDRTMLISLIKDGNEVDPAAFLNAGETYVYRKRVGSVSDLPIIMVRFDTVFMGTETQMAILKGIFQISENYVKVNDGDRYGAMEITETSENEIAMENDNSIDLSSGNTVDLMGNLKILVANNNSVRFALFAQRTGTYNVRGTIYPSVDEWTPMNFGENIGKTSVGFYYDIDDDIGAERLKIGEIRGGSIPEGKLVYSTSPQDVSFNFGDFGKYQVIGFMADKYFAGYTERSIISDNDKISTIGNGQLHKVLLDDDEKRVVTVGGTITLKEGYVLKAKEIDVGVGTGQMWMTLLKNGNEIDDEVVAAGDSYIYKKKVGSVDGLPIIAVHIDSVFRGREINAAFIKGVFQLSDTYTQVRNGDNYGIMEITATGQDKIIMENGDSIDISSDGNRNIMGNITFKVAKSGNIFYPFVTITPETAADQLRIESPSKATAGDTIKIKVTAGGDAVEGVSISIDPQIGLIDSETDIDGTVNYTLSKELKGTYNITATKLGYEKTSKGIEILGYIAGRLNLDVPIIANQFETLTIKVDYNNTPISDVNLMFDNKTIGITDKFGRFNYTLNDSGTHTITASKTNYISVAKDIEVRVPFSEFKALDINIVPNPVFKGDNVLVKSNITNAGTKGDTLPIVLIINDTEVVNRTITLNPKDTKEVNFTYNVKLDKGNFTVKILEQNKLLEVREKPLNILLLVGMITIIGIIIVYLLTREKGSDTLSLDKLNLKLSTIFKKFKK